MTIEAVENEIVEEFGLFDNKNDQYAYIIEMGKSLEDLEEAHKTEQNVVKGCQSKVWLHADYDGERIRYVADSDAMIVRGLIALLLRALSDRTPEEIAQAKLAFIDRIGLKQMLSMTRSNGLAAMVKQMKMYALAYQAKSAAKQAEG